MWRVRLANCLCIGAEKSISPFKNARDSHVYRSNRGSPSRINSFVRSAVLSLHTSATFFVLGELRTNMDCGTRDYRTQMDSSFGVTFRCRSGIYYVPTDGNKYSVWLFVRNVERQRMSVGVKFYKVPLFFILPCLFLSCVCLCVSLQCGGVWLRYSGSFFLFPSSASAVDPVTA